MKTYKITISANGYQASRNGRYNWQYDAQRNATAIIEQGLELKDAQKSLVDLFNEVFDSEIGARLTNWGLIRCNFPHQTSSSKDGTRAFDHDGYYYHIELEND